MRNILALLILISASCTPVGRDIASNRSCLELFKEISLPISNQRFYEVFLDYAPSSSRGYTVGIENEFLVPYRTGRRGVADFLEAELRKEYPGVPIKRNSYVERILEYEDYGLQYDVRTLIYTVNGETKKWTITPELIFGEPGTEICEVASPVMRTQKEINFYTRFMRKLEAEKGARAYPRSGGVHFHYGTPDLSDSELKLVTFAYYKLNDELSTFFEKNGSRQHVFDLTTWSDHFEKYFSDADLRLLDDEKILTQKKSILRYEEDFETIELRLLNSSMDKSYIDAGLELHSKLINAVRSKNPDLIDYLLLCYNGKQQAKLEDLAGILNLSFGK